MTAFLPAPLFIGERTVESHLARIYAKLGVDSKLELIRRAADLGLAEQPAGPPGHRMEHRPGQQR